MGWNAAFKGECNLSYLLVAWSTEVGGQIFDYPEDRRTGCSWLLASMFLSMGCLYIWAEICRNDLKYGMSSLAIVLEQGH